MLIEFYANFMLIFEINCSLFYFYQILIHIYLLSASLMKIINVQNIFVYLYFENNVLMYLLSPFIIFLAFSLLSVWKSKLSFVRIYITSKVLKVTKSLVLDFFLDFKSIPNILYILYYTINI